MSRRNPLLTVVAGAIVLAACDRNPAPPKPPESPPAVVAKPTTPPPAEIGSPAPSTTGEPSQAAPVAKIEAAPSPSPSPALDKGALNERRDPQRVLRFYAAAIAARDWASAAKAWGPGSGVTAKTLKEAYDRPSPPRLAIGKGEGDAAAGSQFYEAPVVLRFGAGQPERGTLILRRVNDIDGATTEQLRWHIERSTIGAGA